MLGASLRCRERNDRVNEVTALKGEYLGLHANVITDVQLTSKG